MRPTLSGAKWRSCRSAAEWNVPARTRVTPSAARRARSSPPALSVNVTAMICAGSNTPVATCCAIRRVIVVVFPVPAPARMQTGPRTASAARRCSGFSPSSGSTRPRYPGLRPETSQEIERRAPIWRSPDVASEDEPKPARQLRLRRPDICSSCGISLSKGAYAIWNPADKTVTCLACAPGGEIDTGVPGASAAAEGERRRNRKVDDVRRKYGDHAAQVAEVLAARDEAATWGKGSKGESWLADYIDKEVGDAVIALHDRLIPGTPANIDHLFVTPKGVWVVDAKA